MKKYKIGKRIIKADSLINAVKIAKLLDSPATTVKSKDDDIEELTAEEQQAVEDYRKAIRNTSNPKLLKIYSHILEEETEHLQELSEAKELDDGCGKMKDDRLSPMTYKKLKELGVRPEQWKKWTQEQANEFIRQKSQKGSNKTSKNETSHKSRKTFSISEELAEGESIEEYKDLAKKYGVKLSNDGKQVKIRGTKEAIRKYMEEGIGVDIDEDEFSEETVSNEEIEAIENLGAKHVSEKDNGVHEFKLLKRLSNEKIKAALPSDATFSIRGDRLVVNF